MRDDIIPIIRILAINYNEIFIDIDLDEFMVNFLEIRENIVIVHSFVNDMDIEFIYDDLVEEDKKVIYQSLCSLLYN